MSIQEQAAQPLKVLDYFSEGINKYNADGRFEQHV